MEGEPFMSILQRELKEIKGKKQLIYTNNKRTLFIIKRKQESIDYVETVHVTFRFNLLFFFTLLF